MNVVKTKNGSELLIELEGSINSATAPELNNILEESVKDITSLILDFKKVDYISSAGLRVLLVFFKVMSKQGNMVIRHPNSNVMDIFQMTGFVNILNIEQ